MKGLVVGFGSIGQRHARIMAELGIDVAVVSRRDVAHDGTFTNIADALSTFAPDYIVVASRTHEHRGNIETLAEHGFAGRLLDRKSVV